MAFDVVRLFMVKLSLFNGLLPVSRRVTGPSSQISSARSEAPILALDSGQSAIELGPSNYMEASDLEAGVGSVSGQELASQNSTVSTAAAGAAASGTPAGVADVGQESVRSKVKKAAKFVCSLTLPLFTGIIITVIINMRKAAKNGKELGFYRGSVGAALLGCASDLGLLVCILMEARTETDAEGLKKSQIQFMAVSIAFLVLAIVLLGLNVVL